MRDYLGFNETEHQLLTLRPNQRAYWIGLAISYHLLGQYTTAIEILDSYEKTAKGREDGTAAYEHSELMMYKNMILEESGNYELQLNHLLEIKKDVLDTLNWNIKRGTTKIHI